MQYVPGVVVGGAFDTGYLYVNPPCVHDPWPVGLLIRFQSSYDRHWVRTSSDVDVHVVPHLSRSILPGLGTPLPHNFDTNHLPGLSSAGCRYGAWPVVTFSAVNHHHWTSFQATKGTCHWRFCLSDSRQWILFFFVLIIDYRERQWVASFGR
jgi:hypothetical protein